MLGPFSDRQKCWEGSAKKSSSKSESPQIWQRWASVRVILMCCVEAFVLIGFASDPLDGDEGVVYGGVLYLEIRWC